MISHRYLLINRAMYLREYEHDGIVIQEETLQRLGLRRHQIFVE